MKSGTASGRGSGRWLVLATGTLAQASYSALYFGVAVMAPTLRTELDLSLSSVGLLLALMNLGAVASILAWGELVDRIGSRAVGGIGLVGAGTAMAFAAFAGSFRPLAVALTLASLLGASVSIATGRAVMRSFGPERRGTALGIRQTAIPLGAIAAALVLPHLGMTAGFLSLAGFSFAAGVAVVLVIPGQAWRGGRHPAGAGWPGPLSDARLWWLSIGSAFLLTPQACVIGYGVLFFHEARGLSPQAAGAVIAVAQFFGGVTRIATGRWSDRLGSRIVPLRYVTAALFVAVLLTTLVASAPLEVVVPTFVVTGTLAMGWNALAFTAALELGGDSRTGLALGFQQTLMSIWIAFAAAAFALLVDATSWKLGFGAVAATAVAAWWALAHLPDESLTLNPETVARFRWEP
jgi:sugar phosphate permease